MEASTEQPQLDGALVTHELDPGAKALYIIWAGEAVLRIAAYQSLVCLGVAPA